MKLLICTQKVDIDDDVLGFFHRWLLEFTKHYEKVLVLCLEKGRFELPSNVEVYSLGKEEGASTFEKLSRFYRFIWKRRDDYDRVFVHMNPEYVVLGGILWRLFGVRVGLWYTHRAVHWKLRIAEKLSHIVFSAAGASFRLKSKKLHILHHGIDVEEFNCGKRGVLHTPLRIIVVGRITPIKGDLTIVEAARILKERGFLFELVFIGKAATQEDKKYVRKILQHIEQQKLTEMVSFVGSVPNREIKKHYCWADVALNMVPTGGIDKTVIEAMAAGVFPLTSNQAFEEHFGKYASVLLVGHKDPNDLADKVEALVTRDDLADIRSSLQGVAKKKFGVEGLLDNIKKLL